MQEQTKQQCNRYGSDVWHSSNLYYNTYVYFNPNPNLWLRLIYLSCNVEKLTLFSLQNSNTDLVTCYSTITPLLSIPATNLAAKPFMTPIGPIQLTAEECNEILMKRALQAQGIPTPVIDASQLNHTILNGGLKSLAEATSQQAQSDSIQTTVHQHHLLHTKQEPGTANNSPKVSRNRSLLL